MLHVHMLNIVTLYTILQIHTRHINTSTCLIGDKLHLHKIRKTLTMIQSLRFNNIEQEAIHSKWLEINKKLINSNKAPIQESEFVHLILAKALKDLKIEENGEVTIEKND